MGGMPLWIILSDYKRLEENPILYLPKGLTHSPAVPCSKVKVQGSSSHFSTVDVGMFPAHVPGGDSAANTGGSNDQEHPKKTGKFHGS